MRIVMIGGPFESEIRAARLEWFLKSRGHDVVFVVGTQHGPDLLNEVPSRHGCRTFVPKYGANIVDAIDALIEPDFVWCHGVTALWRYAGSATNTPEITKALLAGAPLAATDWRASKGRAKLVYDAHEWEPDRPRPYARKRTIADIVERETRAIPICDHIIVPSFELAQLTDARRLTSSPARVITNAPLRYNTGLMIDTARQMLRELSKSDGPFVVFSGAPTPDRDLATLQTALELTKQKMTFVHLTAKERCPFADVALSMAYPWPDSTDITMLDALAACDVAFNGAWIDWENWRSGAPNKMYEYGFAGVSQVAPKGMIAFERLNHTHALGATYDGSPADLAAQLDALSGVRFDRMRFMNHQCYESANGPVVTELGL